MRPAGLSPMDKPEPPEGLSIEAAKEWRAICRPLPYDWFTGEMPRCWRRTARTSRP